MKGLEVMPGYLSTVPLTTTYMSKEIVKYTVRHNVYVSSVIRIVVYYTDLEHNRSLTITQSMRSSKV